jgi:hypothetical protein
MLLTHAPASWQSYAPYFELPEANGFRLSRVALGTLPLPSGRLVLADPFGELVQSPMKGPSLPALARLEACLAEADDLEPRIALLRLSFGQAPAAAWHLAVAADVPDTEVAALAHNEFLGVELPQGMLLMADVEAYEQYLIELPVQLLNGGQAYADAVLQPALAAGPAQGQAGWIAKGAGALAVACWGEGLYPAYWGLDQQGQAVELVIDFLVLGAFDELE